MRNGACSYGVSVGPTIRQRRRSRRDSYVRTYISLAGREVVNIRCSRLTRRRNAAEKAGGVSETANWSEGGTESRIEKEGGASDMCRKRVRSLIEGPGNASTGSLVRGSVMAISCSIPAG